MPDGRRPLPEPRWVGPEIVHTPGMTDDLMREIAPLLAEDGIDLNDPGSIPDMSVLQRALDRAIERRNMALFATLRAGRWSVAGRPSTAPRTATPPFDKHRTRIHVHRTRIHVHRTLIGIERSGSRSLSAPCFGRPSVYRICRCEEVR